MTGSDMSDGTTPDLGDGTEPAAADTTPRPRPRPAPRPAGKAPAQADSGPAEAGSGPAEADSGPAEADSESVETDSEPVETDSESVEAEHAAAQPVAVRAEIAGAGWPKHPARPPGKRSPWWLVIVLALIAVLFIAAAIVFPLLKLRDHSLSGREKAMNAAKTYAAYVMSYDYRKLDDNASQAAAHLTEPFRTEYLKSMNEVIKPGAPPQKAVVEGTIDSAALVSVSPNGKQIVVLITGTEKVTNLTQVTPRTDPVRLHVTLDKAGKDWKISQLQALGGAS